MNAPIVHRLGPFTTDLLALFTPSEHGLIVEDGGHARALAAARSLPAAERDDAATEVLAAMVKMARLAGQSCAADAALDVLGAVVFELYGAILGAALLTPILPSRSLTRVIGAASVSTKAPPPPAPSAPSVSGAGDDDDLYARLLG